MSDPSPRDDSDFALMRAVAAGERRAVAELYDRHASAVYGMAMSLLRDPAVAQDVSQETFVRLWTRAGTFEPTRGTAQGWLVSIARNLALDELRSQRRRIERAERVARDMDTTGEVPDESLLEWGWESAHVHAAVAELSAVQRQTVELVYLQGYTLTEVAGRLGVAVGTVKSRLHSALLSLRAALAQTSRPAGPAAEARGA